MFRGTIALLLACFCGVPQVMGQEDSIFGNLFGGRCSGSQDRCFLGFGYSLYDGIQGEDSCRESCVFFPLLRPGLTCGTCELPPPPAPTSVPTASAAPTATAAPTVEPVPSNYDIFLDLVGIPESDESFFTNAKARWETIVTRDLTDIPSSELPSPDDGCTYPEIIDDVYICARFSRIDGPLGILGSAGPDETRNLDAAVNPGLTITGFMTFDSDDLDLLRDAGGLANVILHEMGHVLGK